MLERNVVVRAALLLTPIIPDHGQFHGFDTIDHPIFDPLDDRAHQVYSYELIVDCVPARVEVHRDEDGAFISLECLDCPRDRLGLSLVDAMLDQDLHSLACWALLDDVMNGEVASGLECGDLPLEG